MKRIGSVPYLNSVPLTHGIEHETEYDVPSRLAEKLRTGQHDAALVSITEALFNDGYDVLDGVAVASRGEVKSVFLAHRQPLDEIETIHCDTASLTSVNLLRLLFAEHGRTPKLEPPGGYRQSVSLENVLLIGNPAIDFLRATHEHKIWDLGTAWHELTGLPFVYAVWALRRGHHEITLREKLHTAKTNGLAHLAQTIETYPDYDADFRQSYLGGHICYDLGDVEKAGLAKFSELLKTQDKQEVYEPSYV